MKNPTIELTVDYVKMFGMKVDWGQVLRNVFAALTARVECQEGATERSRKRSVEIK